MQRRRLAIAAVLATLMSTDTAAFAHGGHREGGREPAHQGGGHRGDERGNQGTRTLSFRLSGSDVPGGGDTDGRGLAALRLYPDSDVVCLNVDWSDLDGAVTALHIHRGPAGETGPHHIEILNDEHLAGRSNRVELCVQVAGGHHEGAEAGDPIQQVIDEPVNFYLNIHSTDFPSGAIRGQLDD